MHKSIDQRARWALDWYFFVGPRCNNAKSARANPEDMREPPDPNTFGLKPTPLRAGRHRQSNRRKAFAAKAWYQRKFDINVWRTPQLPLGQSVIVEEPSAQMIQSARMANAFFKKMFSKTVRPSNVISATLVTVTVDDSWIHNTVLMDTVTLSSGKANHNS